VHGVARSRACTPSLARLSRISPPPQLAPAPRLDQQPQLKAAPPPARPACTRTENARPGPPPIRDRGPGPRPATTAYALISFYYFDLTGIGEGGEFSRLYTLSPTLFDPPLAAPITSRFTLQGQPDTDAARIAQGLRPRRH
jgi:hypothetical protein